MQTRLFNLWESIRTSFWFIPGVMVSLAVVAAYGVVALDRLAFPLTGGLFALVYTGGIEGARSILSTIAGSMITVPGVAFSITIVSLTLASSQFGPRLLRNFMQDKGNQLVLGTFIATFMYCLLVLQSVDGSQAPVFIPRTGVSVAILLALVNVGILIYFVHHVSSSIHADRVIASVNRDLLENIQRLFPQELGREPEDRQVAREAEASLENAERRAHRISAAESDYLQAIDNEGLLDLARKHDLVIRVEYRPGEFITAGSCLAVLEFTGDIDGDLESKITEVFITGPQRTPEQDAEFAVNQLVEVAVRALSPGINDPFTAIACIDRLGSALCLLATRVFPSPYRYDEDNRLRIVARPLTYSGIMNAAFDQIRQNSRGNVAVTIRLLEVLARIAANIRLPEQREAVLRQADMIVKSCADARQDSVDREDIQERYRALQDILVPE